MSRLPFESRPVWIIVFLLISFKPAGPAQLVPDGESRTLSGIVTNLLGNLTVGTNAPLTGLTLIDGSRVTNASAYVGFNASSSSNSVVVDGENTFWVHTALELGHNGARNLLVISNGGAASGSSCTIGYGAGSNNAVVVTGTNSWWRITGSVGAGKSHHNSLLVSAGAFISSGSAVLRQSDTAVVAGPGSIWSNTSWGLYDGNYMVISNSGAMFTSGSGTLGGPIGYNTNVAIICGPRALWRIGQLLGVGYASTGNQLWITNAGAVASGYAYIGYSTAAGTSNLVVVSGGGSLWTNSTSLEIGDGATGNQLVISNGGKVVSGSCTVGPAATGNQLLITETNSLLQVRTDLRVGDSASSRNALVIGNGASVLANQALIGGSSLSSNAITIEGGWLFVTNAIGTTYGLLNLNSGIVEADSLSVTGSLAGKLNLNGGTLRTRVLTSTSGTTRFVIGDGGSLAEFEMLGGGAGPFGVGGLVITKNATLKGIGVITGGVFIATGGMISPGSPTGTIQVNGSLTLSNGSTTRMEVATGSSVADRVLVSNILTYGGTLQVTNITGGFGLGQVFPLFAATTYRGVFTNIMPASPGPGLRWNSSSLTNDGTLRVAAVPTQPPALSAVSCNGSNLALTIVGGNAFEPSYLLTTTNIASGVSNWSRLQTNFFSADGSLSVTNLTIHEEGQRFFSLEVH